MIEEQFIIYVVKQLVDNPDEVSVERIVDDKGTLLKLTVAAEDLGRVIGRHGSTAQSLRNLLRALGTKNDAHYTLKIVDVDRPESQETTEHAPEHEEETDTSTTENETNVETVENDDAEVVDNSSERAKKMRADLADLDDLDI
jgi:predicted RNA-binding protein YlqC (UPF0109 family)